MSYHSGKAMLSHPPVNCDKQEHNSSDSRFLEPGSFPKRATCIVFHLDLQFSLNLSPF